MNRASRILYRVVTVLSVLWALAAGLFLYGAASGDLERLANEPASTFVTAAIFVIFPPAVLFALSWAILWVSRPPHSK